jgi:hypothetical protein
LSWLRRVHECSSLIIVIVSNAKTPLDTQSGGVETYCAGDTGRCEAFEPTVEVTVVYGVTPFDDTGVANGEPSDDQVLDVRLRLFAGGEAQGVAGPFCLTSRR